MSYFRERLLNYLTLFGSIGTLICCALPALLVSLGLGAVLAGLSANIPGLIWLSEQKTSVFIFAGLLLTSNGILLWRNRNAPCPVERKLREACIQGRRTAKVLYSVSVLIYFIGATFAFILPALSL